jgi:hypothetical protein
MLKAFQFVNEVSSAALYVYSETRWEGRVGLIECALKLRKSLPCLEEYAAAQKIGAACSDFLDEPFFERLMVYHKHLKVVHNVSRLFQSHRFPAGHLVLLAYHELATCLRHQLTWMLRRFSRLLFAMRFCIPFKIVWCCRSRAP